jgi:hypothetical protein
MAYIDWDFKCKFTAPSDSSIPGSPTFLNTVPPLLQNPQTYSAQSVTVTSATPGVVTLNSHGLAHGDRVKFGGSVVPTGLTASTWYYVIVASSNTFKVASTHGGSPLATSSTGTSVTIDSWPSLTWDLWTSSIFSKADVKLGNSIVMRDSGNHAYGVQGFINTDRASSASMDPESVAEATHPIWADHISQRNKPLTIQMGTLSGNRVALDLKTAIQKVTYGDSNGRRIQSVALNVGQDQLGATAGSEFALSFF